ncbi:hypothetical protein [Pseudonocardia sp. TRM90224]|uniref:hypothetical protein n=1 Tax=Pseudonocardia sp. TRM90224 TaxID=2812678 RepID=UPI001E2BC194|nr:hypothetical protein [Pseudonocardia sp. TRM90224]
MPDRYFVVKDTAHGKFLVAGNEFEMRRGSGVIATGTPYVWHGDAVPEGQPGAAGSAGAREPAGERSTTPVDKAAEPSWRDTAQWRFVPVPDAAGHYYLIDRRHRAAPGGF